MFTVCTIDETVRVEPADLRRPPADAILSALEASLVDQVVHDIGLVVAIYDILSAEGGFLLPSEGATTFAVKFRAVIFRPLAGEIIVGKLTSSSRDGIGVSVEFFEDILVPGHSLHQPSSFDEAEGLWVWEFEGQRMFYESQASVRLLVKDVRFHQPPTTASLKAEESEGGHVIGTAQHPFSPMEVIGAMDSEGLGCTSWWEEELADTADPIDAD